MLFFYPFCSLCGYQIVSKLLLERQVIQIRSKIYECVSEHIVSGLSYNNTDIQIFDCFFSRLSKYTGNGGVIYIVGDLYSMKIEYSMFYCSCSNVGGAVFFSSLHSSIKKICANNCLSSSGHFAYIRVTQTCVVEYLSVSNCANTTTGHYAIYVSGGDQKFDDTNSSYNNAARYSAIGVTSVLSYDSFRCTFAYNKESEGIVIAFYQNSGTVSFANIINNNSPSFGVIHNNHPLGHSKFKYCVIHSNQGTFLHISDGTITFYHSFISHSGVTSSINNNTIKKTQTYDYRFFESQFCKAENALYVKRPLITYYPPRAGYRFLLLFSLFFQYM